MRVFLACPPSMEREDAIEPANDLKQILRGMKDLDVITSMEEFDRSFNEKGSWENWIEFIVNGRHYTSQKPLFECYVMTQRDVDKATAQIAERALRTGKPVFYMEGLTLRQVQTVRHLFDSPEMEEWKLTFPEDGDKI